MFKSLGRFGTILPLTVGYAIVYLFGAGLTMNWIEQAGRQNSRDANWFNWTITSTGELARTRAGLQRDEYETKSGEVRKDQGTPPISVAEQNVWPLQTERFAWANRVYNLFANSNRDEAYWLVLEDPNQQTRLFIAITGLKSKQVVGYIGKHGFQKHVPRGDNALLVKKEPYAVRMAAFQGYNWTQQATPNEWTTRRLVEKTLKDRTGMLCVTAEGVVAIDLIERAVTPVTGLERCEKISFTDAAYQSRLTVGNPLTFSVAIEEDRWILDPLGEARSVKIPELSQGKVGSLYCLSKGGYVYAEVLTPKTTKYRWFNDQCEITDEKEVETHPRFWPQPGPNPAWFVPAVCPIPIVLTGMATLIKDHELAPLQDEHAVRIGLGIGAVLCTVISLLLMEWARRRVAMPRSWGWMVLAILSGPFAAMALLSVRQKNHARALIPPPPNLCEILA